MRSRQAGPAAAIALVLTLSAAACGTTVNGAVESAGGHYPSQGLAPEGPAIGGSDGLGGPEVATADPLASDQAGAPADDRKGEASRREVGTGPRSASPSPNVEGSDLGATKQLKVGVIIPSGNVGAAYGVSPTNTAPEQARAELKAIANHINSHGAFGGHQISLDVQELDRTDESPGTYTRLQNEICAYFAEDAQADFVAATADARTTYANDCYAKHRLPLLTLTPGAEDQVRELSPWIMPPPSLNLSRMGRLLPIALARQGFLTQRVGVVSFDRSPEREIVEKYLVPGINANGGHVLETAFATPDTADAAAAAANIVLKFKDRDIDRVVLFAPGGGMWLFLTQQAESQNWHSVRWGVSTMDSPNFTSKVIPPAQLPGTVGAGYVATIDVAESQVAPPGPRQKFCWDLLNKATGSSYSRYDTPGILALNRCETLFQAQAAYGAFRGRPVDPSSVLAGFNGLGRTYPSFMLTGLDFQPGRVDGVRFYAPFVYDTTKCSCFRYASGWLDIPSGV